jgi:hypothetical protein
MMDNQDVVRAACRVQLKRQSFQGRFTQPGPSQEGAIGAESVQTVGNQSKIHAALSVMSISWANADKTGSLNIATVCTSS